ncbi:hypothetical protein IV203_034586 [Nitzschia inconspicua]|uniref:Uncharacterized protein n=1 Tax=Nitzschia inconspicua TaxID=303405 RepID=A0A9K3K8H6_9STRA|nr:hypothetical protein IV203_002645 [Nitzschia inconspicua]KAG7359488.1 hypothetical protein IV203_034586 [Nitzschia inconspicua]
MTGIRTESRRQWRRSLFLCWLFGCHLIVATPQDNTQPLDDTIRRLPPFFDGSHPPHPDFTSPQNVQQRLDFQRELQDVRDKAMARLLVDTLKFEIVLVLQSECDGCRKD